MGDTLKWQSLQGIQPCKTCSVLLHKGRAPGAALACPGSLPACRPRDSTVLLLLPGQETHGNFPQSQGMPTQWQCSKEAALFYLCSQIVLSLHNFFDVRRRAEIVMLIMLFTNKIDALTILQCFCFIEQNTVRKLYLPSQLFCSTWKINQYKANQH